MNTAYRSLDASRDPEVPEDPPKYPNTIQFPGEFEPGELPVEPDQGPIPAHIPEDPEHDRVVDPGEHESQASPGQQSSSPSHEGAVIPIARHPDDHQSDTSPTGAPAAAAATGLALPHERDESTNDTAQTPDPMMVKAKRDIDAGLVDTDMHAIPGLDAQRRAGMVPGAGGKPARTDGSS